MHSGWFHSIELCLCESIRDREGILVQCWSDFAVAVAQRLRIPQTFSSAVVPISGKKCQPFSPETGALLFFFLSFATLSVYIVDTYSVCTNHLQQHENMRLNLTRLSKQPRLIKAWQDDEIIPRQRWPKVALSASHCGVSLASKRRSTLGSSKCVSPWCSVKMNFFLRCTPPVADGEIKSYPCLPNPG